MENNDERILVDLDQAPLTKMSGDVRSSREVGERALFGALPDLIFLLSRQGIFLDYYAPDPKLLYLPPEKFLGRSIREVLPKETGEQAWALCKKVIETRRVQTLEYSLPMGGESRHFEARLAYCEGDMILTVVRDITDLKRSEEALRESEERYRKLVELSPDAVALHQDGRIIFANPAAARLVGAACPEELVGKPVLDFVHPDYHDIVRERIRRGLVEGRTADWIEEKFVRLDGNTVDVEVASVPFTYRGRPAMQVVARDITESKRTEEALRASEERYRLLVENAHEAIVVAQDGVVKFANPKALEIFRISEKEAVGAPLAQFIHPDDRDLVIDRHIRRLRGEELPSAYDFRIVDGAGNFRWVQLGTVRILWEGKPATLNLLTDITERKRAEEALRASEAQFRGLTDLLPQAVFEIDANFTITYANKCALEWTGYTQADLEVGVNFLEVVVPDDRKRVQQTFETILSGVDRVQQEFNLLRRDRTVCPVIIYAAPIVGNDRATGIRGVMVDVSQLRQQEQERLRLVTAIEQAAEIIVITDPQGIIQYINPAFERVTGYIPSEMIGQCLRVVVDDPRSPDFYSKLWETVKTGNIWTGHSLRSRKDGRPYHQEVTVSPVRDPSGRIVNFVAVMRDVTQEKLLEEQLFQAQKMEAIGRLAGSVAHDFNNLLTDIMASADLLLLEIGSDHPLRQEAEQIASAARSAARLTHQLLAFSRKQVVQPRILNLNEVVADTERMLRHLIGEDIELVVVLDPNLSYVKVDPIQIEQVILNLALNARDAMPKGGKLTITTKNFYVNEEFARQRLGMKPGLYAMMSVTDTGVGMDSDIMSHIFEPFFTTKEPGKGTGLGLSTVYGIVKQSDGFIDVQSEVGRGSTFTIYLPSVEEPSQPPCRSRSHSRNSSWQRDDSSGGGSRGGAHPPCQCPAASRIHYPGSKKRSGSFRCLSELWPSDRLTGDGHRAARHERTRVG